MQTHLTTTNYLDLRYQFLKKVEGEPNDPVAGGIYAYVDTAFFKERGTGIATIGIGINLREHKELVLQALGLDIQEIRLTGAARDAERAYIARLYEKINREYASNNTSSNQFLAEVNAILAERAANPVYANVANFVSEEARIVFVSTPSFLNKKFALPSTDESKQLFTLAMDGYYVPQAGGVGVLKDGYETTLDNWLTITGVSTRQPGLMTHDSNERIALLSLAYNSRTYGNDQLGTPWNDRGLPTLLGPKLTNALLNDDRAEVWYEIRYNSGNDPARRFLEADTFGLYNVAQANNDIDAKGAFRTYTRHKAVMDAYENDPNNQAGITTAINRGSLLGVTVRRLQDNFANARTYLTAQYGQGINITGDILVGEDDGSTTGIDTRYYRNTDADVLTGSGQSDLIFGESGNDVLEGREGADVLHGGQGQDIYRIRPEDGNDVIIDSDGKGLIVYGPEGQTQALALGIRQPNSDSLYRSPDGSVVYQLNGPDLTVTLPNQQRITVKNYNPGDLHLALIDKPETPAGNTLTGTDADNADVVDTGVPEGLAGGGVLDRNWQGYQPLGQLNYPASGELGGLYFISRDGTNTVYSTILGQGGDDFLLGNPGAENIKLDGGAGNDWIIADYNDVYSAFLNTTSYVPGVGVTMAGGAGNDALQGGFHDDWIEGGTGHDQVYGGQGEDYLAGGMGNDWLAASDGNDVLDGGADNGFLVAQSGNAASQRDGCGAVTRT